METFLRDLMLEQQEQGHEVRAIVHRSERSLHSLDEQYVRDARQLQVTRVARWAELVFAPISPTFPIELAKLLREFEPDVLHIHLPNPSAFWCLILLKARRIPWIVQWHSDVIASPHSPGLRLLTGLYRLPERRMLGKARTIIASSPPYLESSATLNRWRDKCEVIPLGIEDPGDTAESHDDRQPGEVLKVLSVGRLTYYKGYEILIRAAADCDQVEVTLAGDGEERSRLAALAEELGVNHKVRLVGACSDDELSKFYASHDVFCLPSIERTESFGIVLLEAMRHGLPCIVTDVTGSGMKWVIGGVHSDTSSGFVVPPGDPSALAQLLQELADDRGKLSPLGMRARTRFKSMFNMTSCARTLTQVYAKTVRKNLTVADDC